MKAELIDNCCPEADGRNVSPWPQTRGEPTSRKNYLPSQEVTAFASEHYANARAEPCVSCRAWGGVRLAPAGARARRATPTSLQIRRRELSSLHAPVETSFRHQIHQV
eukprot:scaffold208877_cov26-Tisochrysis_lutea.AAC.1